jgi:release factor glutamine methyltransferase
MTHNSNDTEAQNASQPIWTVQEILRWTSQRFAQVDIATPLLDAQVLLCFVMKISRVELYTQAQRPLTSQERSVFREFVRRRLAGEPVAYLLGKKDWHDLSLYVDKRVLIPRPETESLLDFALEVLKSAQKKPRHILDLCTGSGCLAVAFAKRFPEARVFALDISQESLEVAELNARENGVSNIEFMLADVTKLPVLEHLRKIPLEFDVVVANPPYVSENEWMLCDVSVKNFEPKLALTAAEDGLQVARLLYENVIKSSLLSDHSLFCMEVGLVHCAQLNNEFRSNEQLLSFGFSHPVWRLPRDVPFALQDLTARDRFWTILQGLPFAAVV